MEIAKIVSRDCCVANIAASDKKEALRFIAEQAAQCSASGSANVEVIENALWTREKDGSTGFGNEIAIPHAAIAGMSNFVVSIFTSTKGINFDAIDKKRVKIIFSILGPFDRPQEHLQILALISRTLGHTNVKNELLSARSGVALYETFLRHTDLQPRAKSRANESQLLIVLLYNEDHIYAVLEALIEEGIEGATVIESVGMGYYISKNPLFSAFSSMMRSSRQHSKTIMSMVSKDSIPAITQAIENIVGDADDGGEAMYMLLPVALWKGNMNIV